jgi:hypothetical protein
MLARVTASRRSSKSSVRSHHAAHRMIRATVATHELNTKSRRCPQPIATPEIRTIENIRSRANRPYGRSCPSAGIKNTVRTSKPRNRDRFSWDSHVCAIRLRPLWSAESVRSFANGLDSMLEDSLRSCSRLGVELPSWQSCYQTVYGQKDCST